MKKIFIVLSVLAAMTIGTVPAQALIGTPDAVPGTRIVVPFFIVSMTGYGYEDTLVSITDVGKASDTFYLRSYVYNRLSKEAQDKTTVMTKSDVYSPKMSELLAPMGSAQLATYEYDLDADGTNDSYIGYAFFYETGATNALDSLTGFALVYDLAAGKAGGYIPPAKEYAATSGVYASTDMQNDANSLEAFSADAYVVGKSLLAGGDSTTSASSFQLSPRYYLLDSGAYNYFFIWCDRNLTTNGTVHVNYYDEAEASNSTDIDLPAELTVLNVNTEFVPSGGTSYPFAGWVNITMTIDEQLGSTEWLGYNYMLASGSASETWLAINEIHRDADTN